MSAKEINSITGIIADANLKAYYRFSTGALTTDSSGEGHTLTDISDPAEVAGVFGEAVSLDGNDAYSATDHADFKPTGNFTIGCWVKTSAAGLIFQSYSANTNRAGIYLYVNGLGVRLASAKNTGVTINTDYKQIDGNTSVVDGVWHFVVGTWDGSYLRIYTDGRNDATPVAWANAPVYAATNYVRIGCNNAAGTNGAFLTGVIDDLFIINGTALTADEIGGIYWGFKSINGLGISSVKSINGVAKANIKSFN